LIDYYRQKPKILRKRRRKKKKKMRMEMKKGRKMVNKNKVVMERQNLRMSVTWKLHGKHSRSELIDIHEQEFTGC
jgi:hypothetical protein